MPALLLQRGLELTREYGQYVSGKRLYFIKIAGYSLEQAMYMALNDNSIPSTGAAWSSDLPRLCVHRASISRVIWKPQVLLAKFFILLEYRLEEPTKGYPLRGGGAAVQIQTGKNRQGTDITVTYGGKTIKDTVNVFGTEASETRVTVELTDNPGEKRAEWLNALNQDIWMGEKAHMWMITRIEYELINAVVSPNRYRFTWEFSKTPYPDGWDPPFIYRNRYGEIPSDANWETLVWYDEKNFSEKFPWEGQVLRDA